MHTLMPLFDWILAAGTRASVLTVAVLFLQAALRHHVPARWRYALWLPVLTVLITPVFPESQWSVSSITRLGPVSLTEPPAGTQDMAIPTPAVLLEGEAETSPMPWRQLLCWTWLAGASSAISIGLVSYMR